MKNLAKKVLFSLEKCGGLGYLPKLIMQIYHPERLEREPECWKDGSGYFGGHTCGLYTPSEYSAVYKALQRLHRKNIVAITYTSHSGTKRIWDVQFCNEDGEPGYLRGGMRACRNQYCNNS